MHENRRDVIKLASGSPAMSALSAFAQDTVFTVRSSLVENWAHEWSATHPREPETFRIAPPASQR